ncbi:methyltransferase domain-containing protein [Reyranella sp.]|uniref:methyltransferase domain-containing protein n=1 Tax=Reyranella sp. TaxID=1929291 RepID=UPI003BAC5C83
MKLPIRSSQAQQPPAERWADAKKTFGHANPNRARDVADKIIGFGIASVLDLGCGNMKLGEFIRPAGVGYVPADVVARSPDCLVVDLNAQEVPRVEAECAVMIGILEFLDDPMKVLRDISTKYRRVMLTLSPLQTVYDQVWPGKPHSILCTHITAFGLNEFKKLFLEHFVLEDIDVISTGQYLLLGQSRRLSQPTANGAQREQDRLEHQQIGIGDNNIDFDFLAGTFESHIFKSVPFHSMFLRTTALLAAAVARPGTTCVDIGCSTGRLARLIRRRLKETVPVEIVAVDNAREMIAAARRKDSHPLTKYVLDDIESFELPSSVVFVSCLFTLQFLEFDVRKRVLEKIQRSLDWRGCAVVAEKVVDQDGKQQMTHHYLLNAYKHAMGFSDEEVLSKERAVRSALRPLSREQNLEMFREAGFEHAQVVASIFGWELYLLERGPARSAASRSLPA